MSDLPKNLRYTQDHEWARTEADGTVVVGITAFAVEQLGDITAVSLPSPGERVSKGERFGDVDSVKAVSDLYAPIDGEVVEINRELDSSPEVINDDPYGAGWMIRIKPANPGSVDDLLDVASYAKLLE